MRETPKLPLSATAPAEEHGGTAHAPARHVPHRPRASHLSTVLGALHPAAAGSVAPVGGPSWGCTWSTHQGMVTRPHAERLRQPRIRREGRWCSLHQQCFLPLGGRVLFKDRGPGAALGGDKGGFRFNDSTGVGRLPRSRLKIESPTSREGGSGTCVARAGSPGAVFAGGWGSSVGIPMARGFQARPATKQRQRVGGSASSAHCGTPLAQAPLTLCCLRGGRRRGFSG